MTAVLREQLRQPEIIVAPGAYDCLTAKLMEREGFSAVYLTGGGTMVGVVEFFDIMSLQKCLALDLQWAQDASATASATDG
jgi:2-methylisocitrate lyase-like PEP mutase family enzyme